MSTYRITVPPLERVTRAIGYVCVYWAWLEDHIGEMILDLAPFDKTKLRAKEIEQIRDVIFVDADIRTKIKILRAVAFIRKWDDAWFNQMDKVLNKIDNDIRVRRNRIVHSMWFAPKGRLERHRNLAALKKPQAFAKAELVTTERTPVKMREIWRLGRDIISAMIKLIRLGMRHDGIQKYIDEEVKKAADKATTEAALKMVGGIIREHPQLLPALLAISAQPNPDPLPPDSRPKSTRSRRPRRQPPSQG